MSDNDRYVPGDWNAMCWECGRKKKAGDLWKYWQGYYICPRHWNPRQPQDYAKGVKEVITPSWVQPMANYIFSGPQQYTVTSNCFIPEFSSEPDNPVFLTMEIDNVLIGPFPILVSVTEGVYICLVQVGNGWGLAPTISISPSSGILASDGSATYTITVNTEIEGQTIYLSASLGGSTFTPTVVTDSNGEAVFTVTAEHAGNYTWAASVGQGGLGIGSVSGVFGINVATSTVTVSTPAEDLGIAATATVTLLDGAGGPVAGHTVTLAASPGSGLTIGSASGVSDEDGVVTFPITGTIAQAYTLTATDTTQSVVITDTATFTALATITISPSSGIIESDGTATYTITVTTGVASQSIALVADNAGSTFSTPQSTNGSGVATFTVTSLTADTYEWTATNSTTSTLVGSVSGTYGIDAATSTVTVASGTISVGDSTTVTVTLLDGNSDPVAGHVVTLAAVPGSGLTVGAASGPSDASGVVTFTVTAVSEDTYVLTATDTTQNQVITDTAEVLVDPAFVFSATVVTLPSTGNWNAAGYNPATGDYCIVSWNSNKSAYSTDGGTTWNATTLPATQYWGVPMANPLGTFTTCSGNFGGSSAHGGVAGGWTAGGLLPAVVEECGLYLPLNQDPINIVVQSTGSAAATYTSEDGGVTWDTRNSTPNAVNVYLSLAGYGTSASATSCLVLAVAGNRRTMFNDAATINWSSLSAVTAGACRIASNGTGSVRPEPRFFAVVKASTEGATSNDGTTWNAVTLPASLSWFQPVWCKNRWVLFSASNKVYTSATAATGSWTEHTIPITLSDGPGSLNYTVWPANVNGDAYATVVPNYGTNQAILIRTVA